MMALQGYHTDWLTGSYWTDLISYLKTLENADLKSGISSQINIASEVDGGVSVAIGYGFDLLKNSNNKINEYLTSIGLPSLSLSDAELLAQARLDKAAGFVDLVYLNNLASSLQLRLPSEFEAELLLEKFILNEVNPFIDSKFIFSLWSQMRDLH